LTNYAFCYAASSGLQRFSIEDYKAATERFCGVRLPLEPDRSVSYSILANGYYVIAAAGWAKDQTGCSPQKTFDCAANEAMYEDCRNICLGDYYCNGGDIAAGTISCGVAYVLKPLKNGCILLSLYAQCLGRCPVSRTGKPGWPMSQRLCRISALAGRWRMKRRRKTWLVFCSLVTLACSQGYGY
jgi:hypothetical protein